MKIILKHSYYNFEKTFKNKGEMVDYIKNYKMDAKIKSKDSVYDKKLEDNIINFISYLIELEENINDLKEKFFNDYKMKVGVKK